MAAERERDLTRLTPARRSPTAKKHDIISFVLSHLPSAPLSALLPALSQQRLSLTSTYCTIWNRLPCKDTHYICAPFLSIHVNSHNSCADLFPTPVRAPGYLSPCRSTAFLRIYTSRYCELIRYIHRVSAKSENCQQIPGRRRALKRALFTCSLFTPDPFALHCLSVQIHPKTFATGLYTRLAMTDPCRSAGWSDIPPELSVHILQLVLDLYRIESSKNPARAKTQLPFKRHLPLVCSTWAIELRRTALHTVSIQSTGRFLRVFRHMQSEQDGKLPLPFVSLVRELDISLLSHSDTGYLTAECDQVRCWFFLKPIPFPYDANYDRSPSSSAASLTYLRLSRMMSLCCKHLTHLFLSNGSCTFAHGRPFFTLLKTMLWTSVWRSSTTFRICVISFWIYRG